MKQAVKWISRTMKDRRFESAVVRRFRRLLAMIERGVLVPVAQSHREIAGNGVVFVERRTGAKWACTHAGLLDSMKHGLWDVLLPYTGPKTPLKGPSMRREREMPREPRERYTPIN